LRLFRPAAAAALSHAAEDSLAEVRAGRRTPDAALVNAVLGIIDRIGELIQALETGEALAHEDDEQLIRALSEGPAPVAAVAAEHDAQPGEQRKAQRSIRLSVDLLDRMMSGVSDAVLARNELSRRMREAPTDLGPRSRVRPRLGLHCRDPRRDHPHPHAAYRQPLRRAPADGPRRRPASLASRCGWKSTAAMSSSTAR
jgi:chemotaxis protein histidine kinase CheA